MDYSMDLETVTKVTIILISVIISSVAGYIYLKFWFIPKYCSRAEKNITDCHPYEEIRERREMQPMSPTITQHRHTTYSGYLKPSTSDSANESNFTDSSCSRDSAISSSNSLYPLTRYQNASELVSTKICQHDVLTSGKATSPYLEPVCPRTPPIPPRMPIGSPRQFTSSPSFRMDCEKMTYPLTEGTVESYDIHLSNQPTILHENVQEDFNGSRYRAYPYTKASTHISSINIPVNVWRTRVNPLSIEEDFIDEDHKYESIKRNKRSE